MALRRWFVRRWLETVLSLAFLGGLGLTFLTLNAPLAPAMPDCASARYFCVGMVAAVGEVQDDGLNQQTWEALRRSRSADWVQVLETKNDRDYAQNIAFFAEHDYDVIVTVGSAARAATLEAAGKYPDCYFIGVDQPPTETGRDNLAVLVFPEDQAGFLAGALAALVSETGRVGAVCSTQALPSSWRTCEGFRAGAAYVDATTQVNVLYNNAYPIQQAARATTWAETSVRMLLSAGVDVIFADSTATGQAALATAVAQRTRIIATGGDRYRQWPEARPYLLTSILPLVEPGLLTLVRAAARAQAGVMPCMPEESPFFALPPVPDRCSAKQIFPAGRYVGAVGYAPFYEQAALIPLEAQIRLEAIRQALTDARLETGVPAEKP
jgi:basic membrane protein A